MGDTSLELAVQKINFQIKKRIKAPFHLWFKLFLEILLHGHKNEDHI